MLLSDNESDTSWTSEEVKTQNKWICRGMKGLVIVSGIVFIYFLLTY